MKKTLRSILILLMLGAVLLCSGCGLTTEKVMEIIAPEPTAVPGSELQFTTVREEEILPLTLTYEDMDGVFSPFFAEKDGDLTVVKYTQLSLLATEGSRSPTEISRSTNDDGSVTVKIRLREDLECADGGRLTADDLLFTYYVLLDSDYEGPYTLKTLPIRGLSDYWNGMDSDMFGKYMQQYETIYNGGKYDESLQTALKDAEAAAAEKGVSEDNIQYDKDVMAARKALDAYDSVNAELIRTALEEAWKQDAAAVVDFTVENFGSSLSLRTGYTEEQMLQNRGLQVMYAMLDRSLGSVGEDGSFTSVSGRSWDLVSAYPGESDLYEEMVSAYNGDIQQYWLIEGFGRPSILDKVRQSIVWLWATSDPEWRGEITSVSGIRKEDDITVTVTLDYCDEAVLKTLCGIYAAPLRVYGDPALFRPAVGGFGFTKGDLTAVRAQNGAAMGAGQYAFDRTEIRTVYLTANAHFWLGEPEAPTAILSPA